MSERSGGRQMQVDEEVSGQPEEATQLETQEENWKFVFGVVGEEGVSWARAVGRVVARRRRVPRREGDGRRVGIVVVGGAGDGGGEGWVVEDDGDTRDGPRRMGFGKTSVVVVRR